MKPNMLTLITRLNIVFFGSVISFMSSSLSFDFEEPCSHFEESISMVLARSGGGRWEVHDKNFPT